MNSAYKELNTIWNACTIKDSSALKKIIPLLNDHGIGLRQKDGALRIINLSIPTSKENSYVVGLRYIKLDETYTEDHFLCESEGVGLRGEKIVRYPKRKLEYEITEYKGTHKEAPNLNKVENASNITDVSTYSYFLENEKNS